MAYSGRYKPKNPEKYIGDPTKVYFRSMWERHCMVHFDNSSDIKSWSSEETVIPYYYDVDKRYHRYFMDFKITTVRNKTTLIEVKPDKETKPPKGDKRTKRYITEGYTFVKNQNKWEAAREYAKDRGWGFEIWTEKTLTAMGIMPKPYKKMKPLPKFSKKKNK